MENFIIEDEMNLSVFEEEQMRKGYFQPEEGIFPVEKLIKIAHDNCVNFIAGIPRPLLFKLHYLPDKLLSKFNLAEYFSTDINTIKQIVSMSAKISGLPFCLLQTNTIVDEAEFSDFITFCSLQKEALGVVCVEDTTAERKTMKVSLAEDDTITRVSTGSSGYKWTAAGIYYFQPIILEYMKTAADNGIKEIVSFISYITEQKLQLKAYVLS